MATYLVETTLMLGVVVAVAILVLVGARRLGIGRPLGPMRLVGRLPLDARRALYMVRVADRVIIIGVSEAGLTKLGEMPADEVGEDLEPAQPGAFADVLARLKGGTNPSEQKPSKKKEQADE